MTPQIVILIIVIAILIYAFSTHGEKEMSEAKHIRNQFKRKKAASANEDVVSYGQVQERKNELFDVIDTNLGEHPKQSEGGKSFKVLLYFNTIFRFLIIFVFLKKLVYSVFE